MNRFSMRSLQVIATLSLIVLPAQSSSAAFLSYVTSVNTVAAGGSFTVTVNLVAGNGSFTFTNFDNFMGFDATRLTSTGGTVGSFLSGNPNFSTVINPNIGTGVAYETSSSATPVVVPSSATLNPLAVFTFQTLASATGTVTFTTRGSFNGTTSSFYDTSVNPDTPLAMGAPISGSVTITGVPEPASMFLTAVGAFGLLLVSRCTRRKAS